jgi:general secretion pathway protein B
MSYILDALKRAERERKQGQVSVLDEVPATEVADLPEHSLPKGWLRVVLIIAVPLALALAVLLIWRRHGSAQSAAAIPTAAPPMVAAAPRQEIPTAVSPLPQPGPQASVRPPPPPEAPHHPAAATIEDGGRIATLDDVYGQPAQPDQRADQRPDQTPAQQNKPPPVPDFDAERVKRLVAAAAAQNATTASEAQPPPPAAAAAAPTAAEANAAEGVSATPPPGAVPAPPQVQPQQATPQLPEPQPQLQEMPEAYRANFPAITVDVHVYDDNPQLRFVMIGGKRYHEGDTLAEGPRVLKIVPQGMVLDWQGQHVLFAMGH